MSPKKPLIMLSLGALVGAFVYGCSSSSTTNPGTGDDGGAQDASNHVDSAPPADASKSDAKGDAAVQCEPGDVSTFMPPPYVPAHGQAGVCSNAQIAEFYTKCLDTTTRKKADCDAFKMAQAACATCIEVPSTAASWGGTYTHNGVISVNVAGCLELTGGAAGLACAKTVQGAQACGDAACATACPVTDDASFQLYIACISQAAQNGCKTQETAAATCEMNLNTADGGSAICLAGQNFQDIYNNVVPVFCGGGGSTDAGGGG